MTDLAQDARRLGHRHHLLPPEGFEQTVFYLYCPLLSSAWQASPLHFMAHHVEAAGIEHLCDASPRPPPVFMFFGRRRTAFLLLPTNLQPSIRGRG